MNSTDPSLELKDLVQPESLLPAHTLPPWAWYAMAGGAILIALLAILISRMAKMKAAEDPENIRELSYQEALAALAGASQDRIQEVATVVSSALRLYLSRVSGDPALYETHEEFVGRHQVLTRYPEELREATSATFSELARLKYGREASGNADTLVSGARTLLEKLHTVPAA